MEIERGSTRLHSYFATACKAIYIKRIFKVSGLDKVFNVLQVRWKGKFEQMKMFDMFPGWMPGNFKLLWTLISCVSHRICSIRSISWMIHIYYIIHTVNNKHLYTMNMKIHNFNARYDTNLHPPISNLTKFQKWSYYSGIWTFSHLPANIKCLTNDLEHFHIALKRSLNSNSFYTLEEFLNYNR